MEKPEMKVKYVLGFCAQKIKCIFRLLIAVCREINDT